MENAELIEKVAHLEEREKSNTKRIDNLEIKVEDIHELASSVRLLASETKAMREDVNDMNSRLKVVEEKPVKEYENTKHDIKKQIIGFVLGVILCFIAMKLGLGKFL